MEYSKSKAKLNLCLFLVVINIIIIIPLVVGEPQVPCFFIFGDSLVDNGNNNVRSTTAKVNFWPYGIDFPDGPTGRFTNGRNIVDFLAELLGFDKYIPPFANATNQDILTGVNYGSGGAGILDQTGRQIYGDVISFNEQLWNHEVTTLRIAKLLGGENLAKEHLSKCIYYVGFGSNDYLTGYLPKFQASTNLYTPQQYAQILITQYSMQLQKLYDNGARKIAVIELGQLGCVPQELATYGPSDGSLCVESSNKVAQIFNEKLELLVDELNNHFYDAKFVLARKPTTASYDKFAIKTYPCCGVTRDDGGVGQCLPGTVPCSNRDEYLFWDEFHPMESANLIDAKNVYNYMSPLFANPIDVW